LWVNIVPFSWISIQEDVFGGLIFVKNLGHIIASIEVVQTNYTSKLDGTTNMNYYSQLNTKVTEREKYISL
jgi:hypothetical protein